jgi:hypothetical protein
MSAALAALRPRDDSADAVQAAIDKVMAERRAAGNHLIHLRADRATALLDPHGTSKAIAALEADAHETEIRIERLDAMRPGLETQLAGAVAAAQQAEIDRQADHAVAAIAAFKNALLAYPALAAGIAEICRLDRAAQAAVADARRAGRGQLRAFPRPRVIADIVVLPSLDDGMVWGAAPAQPAHYYSPVPVIV